MNREAIFECWAPPADVWSLWARPILFAQMPPAAGLFGGPGGRAWPGLPAPVTPPPAGAFSPGHAPLTIDSRIAPSPAASEPAGDQPSQAIDVSWAPTAGDTAVVIDLPGAEAVLTGLALAGRGFRPVPLFNGCTGPAEVIDQGPIIEALRAGAPYLSGLALEGAPPAFLLDSRREGPAWRLLPGSFDNRWKVFPQDFPSASFLTGRGLRRALLVHRDRVEPAEDLAHVLRRWQDAGLVIEALDVAGTAGPVRITVDEPPWYRAAWQRVLAIFGLRRNWRGGFGGVVPQPSHG